MIKKIVFVAAIFAVSTCTLSAQEAPMHAKKFDHYVGVQANQLLKQLVNLSNGNAAIDNPYLLTYGIYFSSCGYGLHAGIGYNYQQIEDKIPISRITKKDELFYRIGVGRKVMIGRKWQLGYGLDFIGSREFNTTSANSVTNLGFSIDSSSSVTSGKKISTGAGAEVSLGFQITEKIMLGTEATWYYATASEKQNTFATDRITTQTFPVTTTESSTNSNTEVERKTVEFSVPVALFLIIKF
jgi:hypothetical protein